ncbi:glycoside hydrolase family 1 protein [Erysipelotrichaceae bacterium 51-3]
MEQKLQFPEGFWWGAASSGPQTEGWYGKRHENVMDYWYRNQRNDFFDGVGPDVASDFYHHYPEDFRLMKEIGLNSFRTSIQWSRLIKDLETGEPDPEGVEFYRNLIAEAKKNGIELVLNLHHFDLPAELLEKYGGWQSKHVVDLYEKFARTAFELFGDDVKYWTTFNEPMVIPEAGWLYGFHWPKLTGKGKEALQIMYNINLASAKAIQAYRDLEKDGEIGIILNLTPSYPRSQSEEDLKAAAFADDFFNNSFLDPAVKGKFPEHLVEVIEKDGVKWDETKEELETIANNTVDFLGVNYYHPKRVMAPSNPEKYPDWMPDKYYEEWEWPEARINPYRGWEIYPQAMYDIAKNVQDNYGNIKWFVSENGMGVEGEEKYRNADGSIDDDYRIEFYKEHLAQLHRAMEEGSNCFGYHPWTAMDCWSWNNAYKNRYGFIGIDLNDQKRTIKRSGRWFKTVSDENAVTIETEE